MKRRIGPYEVMDELGRGGMGVVYRARQPSLQRMVALKVLPGKFARDEEFLARFRLEAFAGGGLSHPNIVHVYDAGQDGDDHYIAMELVEGETLKDLLARKGKLSPPEIASIGAQVAAALDYAHTRGVVHRDVKPSNILIGSDGQAKLVDFGIARAAGSERLTRAGINIGTPEYMAPEQVDPSAGSIDGRTDVYALGICLYELLAGRVPFSGENTLQVAYAHLHGQPARPDGPAELVDSIMKSIARDQSDRWQTAGDLLLALEGCAPVPAQTAAPPPRRRAAPKPRPRRVRRGWIIPVAAVLTMCLAAGGTLLAMGGVGFRGVMSITSQPEGGEVRLDGRVIGTAPLTVKLSTGTHKVAVVLPGHEPWEQAVVVERGTLSQVRAKLTALPASLTLTSKPSGAQVFIDGSFRDVTPCKLTMDGGTYEVTMRAPGYVEWLARVTVNPSADVPVHAELREVAFLSGKAMVIYESKEDMANEFKDFLAAMGMEAVAAQAKDAAGTLTSDYQLVLIAPDTVPVWTDPGLVAALAVSRAGVLGVGQGGWAAFRSLGLALGREATAEVENRVLAVDRNAEIWSRPNTISVPTGGVLTLYRATASVAIPAGGRVTAIAIWPAPELSPIAEEGRYALWGFDSAPFNLTKQGRDLFQNLVHRVVARRRR
ncbi:MAG: serine/threonine-protein kinase [Bacillota bacterium]